MMVVFTKIIYIQTIASKVLEGYKNLFKKIKIKGNKKKIKSQYGKQLAKYVSVHMLET